jgi:3-phenylpropionate/trans-cinnamate dioxygenase ferredoxin component
VIDVSGAAFVAACPAEDVELGKTKCVVLEGRRVLIVRDDQGYYALGPDCSHATLPLEGGRVRNGALMCPHHGARFELRTGRHLSPPAYTGIQAWPTRVRDGQVEVLLG